MTQRHVLRWGRQEVNAMSKYTTGELAKLCGVTVRTVQYYDNRNILVPTALSEGGRRLYSEEDLQRMKIICFLRDLGLPLDTISALLSEEHPEAVIGLILEQQENLLESELRERQQRLARIRDTRREVKALERFSVESIGDIAYTLENRKKLKRVRAVMLFVGIPLEIVEWLTMIYGIFTGIWWPYLVGLGAIVAGTIWMVQYYYSNVKYICPKCHNVFKPGFREMFWARHTPTTRRLTCTDCGSKGFCVEVYGKET